MHGTHSIENDVFEDAYAYTHEHVHLLDDLPFDFFM